MCTNHTTFFFVFLPMQLLVLSTAIFYLLAYATSQKSAAIGSIPRIANTAPYINLISQRQFFNSWWWIEFHDYIYFFHEFHQLDEVYLAA